MHAPSWARVLKRGMQWRRAGNGSRSAMFSSLPQTTAGSTWDMRWAVYGLAAMGAAGAWTSPAASQEADRPTAGEPKPALPTFTAAQVAEHNTADDIWVSYRGGVYDVTNFLAHHPGGTTKLMLAAGGSLDPFWNLYKQHLAGNVQTLLEQHRIGNLDPADAASAAAAVDENDPYAHEPKRHPALRYNSRQPANAEPPLPLLSDAYITPNELFYVRNHMPVPQVDIEQWRLTVKIPGRDGKPDIEHAFSLEDLQAMQHTSVVATVQCAGNRRSEMVKVKPVRGLNWHGAAIGNAKWTGVRLRDVLAAALGVSIHDDSVDAALDSFQHVLFEGGDVDPTSGKGYGASTPLVKALDRRGDVLLAWAMNDEPIPPDHGYPLRAVVPGVVGARSVKWLNEVSLSDEESYSHWQRRDYKGFNPCDDWDTANFDLAPSIQELPVTSAITSSPAFVESDDGEVTLKGYAWSGGGRGIVRVDVSADDGKTWHTAELSEETVKQQKAAGYNRSWGWALWEASIPLPADAEQARPGVPVKTHLICKAIDSAYNVQPDTVAPIWNLRGVLSTAWHRVPLEIRAPEDSEESE